MADTVEPGTASEQELAGDGEALAAISRGMVALHKEVYGRGPTKTRTVLDGGAVVVLMRDALTDQEQALVAAGRADVVRSTRAELNASLRGRFVEVVEEVLDRRVEAFMTSVETERDIAAAIFVLAPVLEDDPLGDGDEALRSQGRQIRRRAEELVEQAAVLRERNERERRRYNELQQRGADDPPPAG
jgi:uncharacterized protein YbcI